MSKPEREVDKWELRRLFREGRYLERLASGELFAVEARPSRPPRKSANQPPGTTSELHIYYDLHLQRVAAVHFYRLPDGSIGASGLPDPKRLYFEHETLFCRGD